MDTSNVTNINNNPLHKALLNFGIYDAVPARLAESLVKRGDIIIAQKFFSSAAEFIEFAELTPSGLLKFTDLQHHDTLKSIGEIENMDTTSVIENPITAKLGERLLFSVECIQTFIAEGKTKELFKMMGKPFKY